MKTITLQFVKDSKNFHRFEPTPQSGATGALYLPKGFFGDPDSAAPKQITVPVEAAN